jgi:hypothetical protein
MQPQAGLCCAPDRKTTTLLSYGFDIDRDSDGALLGRFLPAPWNEI